MEISNWINEQLADGTECLTNNLIPVFSESDYVLVYDSLSYNHNNHFVNNFIVFQCGFSGVGQFSMIKIYDEHIKQRLKNGFFKELCTKTNFNETELQTKIKECRKERKDIDASNERFLKSFSTKRNKS